MIVACPIAEVVDLEAETQILHTQRTAHGFIEAIAKHDIANLHEVGRHNRVAAIRGIAHNLAHAVNTIAGLFVGSLFPIVEIA